jgi:predicted esterase
MTVMKKLMFAILLLITGQLVLAQTLRYDSGTTLRRNIPDHYYKMVTWDDTQYKEFSYVNKSATGSVVEFMNWRAIFPAGYDRRNPKKYPMIVMLHGAGESGRSWEGRFTYEFADLRYDNNGHNLLHGGQQHRDAVNRSSTNSRAFPGIVIFPQVNHSGAWESGWNSGQLNTNGKMAIKIIEYMITNYQVDNNKIYLHGLSNGARGTWDVSTKRPDLFAAILPMSGVANNTEEMTSVHVTTPVWLFQGGVDTNPTPSAAQKLINTLVAKGGSPRYTLYPNLAHTTWNTAYAEPDFFSWMLAQDKRKIYVFGGDPRLCQGEGDTVRLGFSSGFKSYQWTISGSAIPGATSRYFKTATVGTYTVKFMRSDNQWYESFPVNVVHKPLSVYSPAITNTGSVVLPIDISAKNVVDLNAPAGFSQYNWFKDGKKIATTTTGKVNVSLNTGLATDAGSYALKVKESSGCQSQQSNVVRLVYTSPHVGPSPSVLATLTALSITQTSLAWTDSPGEGYYEIWRTRKALNGYASEAYKVVGIVNANTLSFVDRGLRPFAQYRYRVRAIGGDDGKFSNEKTVTMPDDTILPAAPTAVQVSSVVDLKATLSWLPSTDNDLVASYEVFLGSTLMGTTTSNSYLFANLLPGTTYVAGVRAVDGRGNRSAMVTVTFYVSDVGVMYKYFEPATALSSLAGFDFSVLPKKSGVTANFDISVRARSDNFVFSFDGFIQIDLIGTYSFFTNSDDGSRLYINNNLVVDNDGLHSTTERTGTFAFTSIGRFPIKVIFFENGGGEVLQVSYDPPGIAAKQLIPNNKLFLKGDPIAISSVRTTADVSLDETEDVEKAKVTAYPNPFIDQITVSRGSTEAREVRLYDHTGKIVKTIGFADGASEANMELRDMPKGIYFISVGNTRIRVLKKE